MSERWTTRVREIESLTSDVKRLVLDLQGRAYPFYAGQWIDLYFNVDRREQVGGYSITSSPDQKNFIEIAVRFSDHPVARSLHEKVRGGDVIDIGPPGGTCVFRPERDQTPLTLIAGGIGITPLLSMLRLAREGRDRRPTRLIYSVATREEAAFRVELERRAKTDPGFRLDWVETEKEGRLDRGKIVSLGLDPKSIAYLCGPAGMMENLGPILANLGLPDSHIRYEKWW